MLELSSGVLSVELYLVPVVRIEECDDGMCHKTAWTDLSGRG